MTYLITGGSGFLGINLIRYFLAQGNQVVSLDVKKNPIQHQALTSLDCDIRKPLDKYARYFINSDVVIHGASALPLNSFDEIYSTIVDGTKNVIALSAETGKRFVFISTTAIYEHTNANELSPVKGIGNYGKSKIVAEDICQSCMDKISVLIIRPKTFIGPERLGIFSLLFDFAATGHHFPIIGNGNNRLQLLHVSDLCRAIEHLVLIRASGAYNVGAEKFKTLREDFQAVLDVAGYGKRIVSLPKISVQVLRLMEKLSLAPVYEWLYHGLLNDSTVDISKIKSTGFNPCYSNQDALRENYNWYLQNRGNSTHGKDHRSVWNPGILGLAKLIF